MRTIALDLDWTPGPLHVDYEVEWSDDGHTPHVVIGEVRQQGNAYYPNEAELRDLRAWCLEDERQRAERRHAERHYAACRRTENGEYAE